MNLIAISGSLRPEASNTALLRALAAFAPPTVCITLYDGLDTLPHYSPERDGRYAPGPEGSDHSPDSVKSLRSQIASADGVVVCTPEYAFGMPGCLKNALDWLVSSGELWRKPVAALSASPSASGGEKAHAALLLTLTALEAATVEHASLNIAFARTRLSAEGAVLDPALRETLRASLAALMQAVSP